MRFNCLWWFCILFAIIPAVAFASSEIIEIRGSVAIGNFTWNADNFPGFYYDIDDNMKTESLTTTVSEGNRLSRNEVDGARGVVYSSTVQPQEFEFEDWGSYKIIGFLAEKYFAGYLESPDSENDVFYTQSGDASMLSDEQLLKILVDDDTEKTFSLDTPLKLKDGYELRILSIDLDGSSVYLELMKDGEKVDSQVVSPASDSSDMVEQTYLYKVDVGDSSDVVLIAVHFDSVFLGISDNVATVDGIWQLSDKPVDVAADEKYDKMKVQTVTSDTITMDNEDDDITLSRDKDISLMPGINIRTADSDDLRYYIYTEKTCEC